MNKKGVGRRPNLGSKKLKGKWVVAFWLYLLILMTIIIGAYLGKVPTRMLHIPMYDLIGHFVLLGTTSFLAHRALGRRRFQLGAIRFPVGPTLVAIFAIIEESLQSLSSRRTFSLSDLSANLCGIIIFYAFDYWLEKVQSKKSS